MSNGAVNGRHVLTPGLCHVDYALGRAQAR